MPNWLPPDDRSPERVQRASVRVGCGVVVAVVGVALLVTGQQHRLQLIAWLLMAIAGTLALERLFGVAGEIILTRSAWLRTLARVAGISAGVVGTMELLAWTLGMDGLGGMALITLPAIAVIGTHAMLAMGRHSPGGARTGA